MDPQEAFEDFRIRRENYSSVYQTVDDEFDGRVPHIKIINSRQFIGTISKELINCWILFFWKKTCFVDFANFIFCFSSYIFVMN